MSSVLTVQFIFPWELNHLGTAWTFFLYAVFATICLTLVVWLLPETRGLTLEKLELELTGATASGAS